MVGQVFEFKGWFYNLQRAALRVHNTVCVFSFEATHSQLFSKEIPIFAATSMAIPF